MKRSLRSSQLKPDQPLSATHIGSLVKSLSAVRKSLGEVDCTGPVCICIGDDDCNDLFSSGACGDGICFEDDDGGVVCLCVRGMQITTPRTGANPKRPITKAARIKRGDTLTKGHINYFVKALTLLHPSFTDCSGPVCICTGDDDCNDLFSSGVCGDGICFEDDSGGVVCLCVNTSSASVPIQTGFGTSLGGEMDIFNQAATGLEAEVLEHYVAPNDDDKEVIVLSDSRLASVFATKSRTATLSASAGSILRNGLLGLDDSPATHRPAYKLRAAVGAGPNWKEADAWLREAAAEGLFTLTTTQPKIADVTSKDVPAGYRIAALHGVPLEYPGRLVEATVNKTRVFWFTASVSLKDTGDQNEIGSVTRPSAQMQMTTLLPRQRFGGVGVNCDACGLCGVCGTCGACGLCGGVDFAAALVAVDAALATAKLTSVSIMAVLREG